MWGKDAHSKMNEPLERLVRRRLNRTASVVTPSAILARADMPHDAQRYARSAVFLLASVTVGGKHFACDVLNISAGGALIRCEDALPTDAPLEISIADYPALRAQIVRSNGNNHGIAFEGDAAGIARLVDEILLDAPHQRDKRLFPRRLVLLAASFYLGDEFVKCKVQNISAGGFYAKSEKSPEAGTVIEFNLARFGTMPVRVIWSNEKGMGGVFLETSSQIINRIGHLLPGPSSAVAQR
jgi:hypothetical protein